MNVPRRPPLSRAIWWYTSVLGFLVAGQMGGAAVAGGEREEIAALRREIAQHDALYFQKSAPQVSDDDYDRLRRRLADLETRFPEAAAATVALPKVADDRTGQFATRRHRERMMSLEKAYTEAELRGFHGRLARQLGRQDLEYVIEPKYDGLAVSVTFDDGRLICAVTRGNGVEGEDITANVLQIANLPRTFAVPAPDDGSVPRPRLIELRGEIFVPWAEFSRVNAEREASGERLFANPRNLAAGTIRQVDSRDVAARGLQIVFFGVGGCEPAAAAPPTQTELQRRLRAWKLPGITRAWNARGPDDLVDAVGRVGRERSRLEFPIDGAVAKLDSLALQAQAGATEAAPRWAIAYKFAAERAATPLRAITLQVGRTGVITPVAELVPVELGGSTVYRATLHNADEIARRDIRVGDWVYVEKAGEIIPAIVGVDRSRRARDASPFVFPAECPECRRSIRRANGEVAYRCENAGCPAQFRRRLEHFASKGCVDIRGLGPAIIEALVRSGRVRELQDLYRLQRDDVAAALGRSAGRSAEQLCSAIEASKRAELWRFINGLGIPQVGAAGARELARRLGSLEALASLTPAGSENSAGANAGEATAWRAACAFVAEPRNRAVLTGLIAAGVRPSVPRLASSAPLAGRTLVLTGTLPTLTRAQATAKIEAAGGRVGGAVSRKTDYVVVGADPGAKLEQARKLGLKVIDEAELQRLLAPP